MSDHELLRIFLYCGIAYFVIEIADTLRYWLSGPVDKK